MINKLLFTALLFVFTSNVFSQVPNYVPSNGLVGYWPFNGNANDESLNGNNGTVDGATLSADRNGNANSAYAFDGIDDKIVCINSGPSGNPTISINFWIKTSSNSYGHLIGYGNDGYCGKDLRIFINGNCNNSIAFDTYCSQKAKVTSFTNNWDNYHIQYDGSIGNNTTVATLYKNGILMGTECFNSNTAATNISSLIPLTFGRYHGITQTGFYQGLLDDVGIWNRILTDCEVTQLFAGLNSVNVNAGNDLNICAGDQVTLNASGANTYSWNNSVSNGIGFIPSANTTYTVTGTNTATGCTNTDQVVVTVNALPTVNAGNDQTICAGTSVTLSGTGADTYSWDNSIINGIGIIPTANSTYTVTGTNTATGCANTDQVVVTVNPLPIVNSGNDQTICAGTSVTLSGTGADTYSWNNGVSNGIGFIPTANSTYTVTGINTVTGCANTDQVGVTVNALPIVNAGNDQTICAGTSVTLSGTGADTYSWNNTVSNGIGFIPSANNITYTVTGTNTTTGCTNTDQVVVTVNALPTVNAGNDQTICIGDNVILNGSGADNYSWDNSVSNGIGFIPSANTTYIVTGTNTATGCTNTDQVVVTVNALPTVNAGNDQAVCAGTSVALSGTGADTYLWDNNIINGIGFIPFANTTYTVTGTNTATGCTNTDQVVVTVNALPTVNAGNDQTICIGDNVIFNGSGAATYSWDNAVIDGISFVPTATEIYHLQGIDLNGCQGIDSVQVFVNNTSSSTLTETALDSYTLIGQTYTQSGTYSQVITNAAGCDSTITLNLTLNYTGIDEMKNFAVSIYPNPSRDLLFIHSEIELFSSFELIDNQGRIVLSDKLKGNQTNVNLEAIAPGNYYLKIEERNILVKVVKQ